MNMIRAGVFTGCNRASREKNRRSAFEIEISTSCNVLTPAGVSDYNASAPLRRRLSSVKNRPDLSCIFFRRLISRPATTEWREIGGNRLRPLIRRFNQRQASIRATTPRGTRATRPLQLWRSDWLREREREREKFIHHNANNQRDNQNQTECLYYDIWQTADEITMHV